MNKRQIKKKVKQAKLNKERGLILSLEDRHYIRNYGKRYYTEKELAYVLINWDEFTNNVKRIFDGVMNAFADAFQSLADAFRRNGGAE
ncbi:hypothetical protein [Trichococcus flocculiformis]|uniref:hypothetical protein n=1 Tax=Trichococcus flocculiformis TaxID=82803 RepID=UPI003DA2A330